MRNIGIDAGHSIYELGPAPDVELFFSCLVTFLPREAPDRDWSLLTDRLYRRYLRINELDAARDMMINAQSIFAKIPTRAVDWRDYSSDETQSWLDIELPTLADVFANYFVKFSASVMSAKSFFEAFQIYQPVRIVISDIPGFARDKKKPLAEYDALAGKPFWLQ